ncbi:MAG TPA: D-alanyl-D-alanine carboxypeptidase/D-alanyl-D-alanine-endopeptidase [Thermodesulfobacteriota bacterium]
MRTPHRTLLGLATALAVGLALHAAHAWAAPADRLAAALDRALADPALKGAQVGALVVEVRSGRVRFARQPDTRFVPASTLKLVTAAAALLRLGPEYAWLTPILGDGALEDGVLAGDLYVRGSGDPSLVAEQVFRLAATVRAAGVTRVEGRVVADGSLFPPEGEPSGWALYDGPEAYRPIIGAASFNFNAVEVTVQPGAAGSPPVVTLEPLTSYIRVDNRATTGPAGTPYALAVGAALSDPADPDSTVLLVSGTLPEDAPARRVVRRVEGPARYLATAVRDALVGVGVDVRGGIGEGPTPGSAVPLAVHRSRALGAVLADMGKFSNNFMAEMVLRTLGVEATGGPAGSAAGLAVLRDVLREAGADPAEAVLVDGSGLSRLNLLSPSDLVAVLLAMERRFDSRAEFAAGFGLLGVDGTVQRRYADSPAARRVRAKTGSLNGVRTLAGYAEGPRGELLAFVLFANNLLAPIDRVAAAERRFVEALTGSAR